MHVRQIQRNSAAPKIASATNSNGHRIETLDHLAEELGVIDDEPRVQHDRIS
jgi:hypothetical protein